MDYTGNQKMGATRVVAHRYESLFTAEYVRRQLPEVASTIQKALAAILAQSGRTTEAIPLWRSILRQYLKTRGPDDNATQQAAQVLQQLLARQAAERPAAEKPAASQPAATPAE